MTITRYVHLSDQRLTEEQCKTIAEWIENNPHAALEIAVSTHNNHWYGCNCNLKEAIDSRLKLGKAIAEFERV